MEVGGIRRHRKVWSCKNKGPLGPPKIYTSVRVLVVLKHEGTHAELGDMAFLNCEAWPWLIWVLIFALGHLTYFQLRFLNPETRGSMLANLGPRFVQVHFKVRLTVSETWCFVCRCRSSRGERVWVTLSTYPESSTFTPKSSCSTECAWCWEDVWPRRSSSVASLLELRMTWRRSPSPPTLRSGFWFCPYRTDPLYVLWPPPPVLVSGGAVWNEWQSGPGFVWPPSSGGDGHGEAVQRGHRRADRSGGPKSGGPSVRMHPAAHQGQEGHGGDGETGLFHFTHVRSLHVKTFTPLGTTKLSSEWEHSSGEERTRGNKEPLLTAHGKTLECEHPPHSVYTLIGRVLFKITAAVRFF